MSSRIAQPVELTVDVSAVLPFAGETSTLTATVHVPSLEHDGPPRAVLVCWPGGSYGRAYWDMHIPGHPGYSFAEHMTDRGFLVIAVDPLGVGVQLPAVRRGRREPRDDGRGSRRVRPSVARAAGRRRARQPPGAARGRPAGRRRPLPGRLPGDRRAGGVTAATTPWRTSGSRTAARTSIESGPSGGPAEDAAAPMQAAVDQAKAFLSTEWDAGYGARSARSASWLAARGRCSGRGHRGRRREGLRVAAAVLRRRAPGRPLGDLRRAPDVPRPRRLRRPRRPGAAARRRRLLPRQPRRDAPGPRRASAHCHNFAATRTVLWDRLGTWAAAVADS